MEEFEAGEWYDHTVLQNGLTAFQRPELKGEMDYLWTI